MAKKTAKSTKSNAETSSDTGAAPTTRQLVVHTQYIKDLSFENPNAPQVLIEGGKQPDVEITVNVGAQLIGDNRYEVSLNLAAKATAGDTALFFS